ncbi:BLUF domain-containing protein [Hymenobacter terricola]|uniref:BLUF domain-containing protein n=1 Tax=Hymenobacter terricola TaxID=2819236 RepID=UPI001B3168C0|nr:BLUF domain-containing protein [Hymenobacter terricola]
MSLYQLIYQSQSLVPFEARELQALLTSSRANNQQLGISGMLLYTPDGRFLQVLEGDQQAVRTLYYHHILADPRHHSCRVLCEGHCLRRSFADWSLAYRAAQAPDLRTLLGYVPPDTPALLVPRPRTRPELVELLLEFMSKGEANSWLEAQH